MMLPKGMRSFRTPPKFPLFIDLCTSSFPLDIECKQ